MLFRSLQSDDLNSIYYNLSESRQALINPYYVDDQTYISQWRSEKLKIKEELLQNCRFGLSEAVFNLAIFGGLSGVAIFGAQFYGVGDNKGMRHTTPFRAAIYEPIYFLTL